MFKITIHCLILLSIAPLSHGAMIDFFSSQDSVNARFGHSVTMVGDWLAISAVQDSEQGDDSGAVYLYENQGGWQFQLKLLGSHENENFGDFVLLKDGFLFVGATGSAQGSIQTGSVYIYKLINDIWVEVDHIFDPFASDGADFGVSLAYEDGTLYVGASAQNQAGVNSGVVHLYNLKNGDWSYGQLIQAADAEEGDHFGHSIAVEGDWLVIGAKQKVTFLDEGRVYVYKNDAGTWTEHQQLFALSNNRKDFGRSVDIDGQHILVGAPSFIDFSGESRVGKAYVYKLNDNQSIWMEQQQLSASSLFPSFFGWTVKLNANKLLVGTVLESNSFGNPSSSVYVFFERFGLHEYQEKLYDPMLQLNQSFSSSIATFDEYILIGAPNTEINESVYGAAYLYQHNYRLNINIKGLVASDQFLQLEEASSLASVYVPSDMEFSIGSDFVKGDSYDLVVVNQPESPIQLCLFNQSSGTFSNNHVYIDLNCMDTDTVFKNTFE